VFGAVISAALAAFLPGEAKAQVGILGAVGGVSIDPDGMVAIAKEESKSTPTVPAQGLATEGSRPLRCVSLRRLEAAIAAIPNSAPASRIEEMNRLAGLSRVQRLVFVRDGDAGDVLLVGPVGSGRDVGLHLEDFVAAMRFVFSESPRHSFVGCSIDPTPQGVKAVQSLAGRIQPSQFTPVELERQFAAAAGPQTISLFGVEGDSRLAWVMVAADYRLKRLSMEHDRSPVAGLQTYLGEVVARGDRRPIDARFWFVGHLARLDSDADERCFEFTLPAVRVQTAAASTTTASTNASRTSKNPKPLKNPAADAFVNSCNRLWPKLTESIPAFQELERAVVWCGVAALIREHDERQSSVDSNGESPGVVEDSEASEPWSPAGWLDPQTVRIASRPVPTKTASLGIVRRTASGQYAVGVSGGVEIDPLSVVAAEARISDRGGALAEFASGLRFPTDRSTWYWDLD
jgi:hypothetical protein